MKWFDTDSGGIDKRSMDAPRFSVFFCRLAAIDLVRLKSRLYDVISLDQDQVLFVPLSVRCASAIEALGRPVEPSDVVIVSKADQDSRVAGQPSEAPIMIKKRGKTTGGSDASRPLKRNNTEAILGLLDEWLQDESGYDEETWPELKVALDRDRLSKRKL